MRETHHISFKNHQTDDFIGTALRVWDSGMPLTNDEFVNVNEFLRQRRQRSQEVKV